MLASFFSSSLSAIWNWFHRPGSPSATASANCTINHLPCELILLIAENLSAIADVNSLMRTNHRHLHLLWPILLDRSITTPPSSISYNSRTILHWAISHGKAKLLDQLLSRPNIAAILNTPDRSGATPLHTAILYKDTFKVMTLLESGARTDSKMNDEVGDGWSPLHCAVYCGNHEILKMLLIHGADPEAITNLRGHTALFQAAVRDDLIAARLLVRIGGANMYACRRDGLDIKGFGQAARRYPLLTLVPGIVYKKLVALELRCGCFRCNINYSEKRS